jgi:hypothetical protein
VAAPLDVASNAIGIAIAATNLAAIAPRDLFC